MVKFRGADGETFRAGARHCVSHQRGVRCEVITLTARVAVPGSTPAGVLDRVSRLNRDEAAFFMFEGTGDRVVCDASSWTEAFPR